MNVRYRVTLEASERVQLVTMVLGGKGAFRRLKRVQILLAADAGFVQEVVRVLEVLVLRGRVPAHRLGVRLALGGVRVQTLDRGGRAGDQAHRD